MTEQGEGLLGSCAIVPASNRFLHNQRIGLIDKLDPDKFSKNFLYYLFNSVSVRGQIRGSATGTKVRHTAPERVYRVRVRVPNVETQSRIGDVLATYDALIANNKRRVELLEHSVRLLYREWFVHLRYPGHEHDNISDGMPKGWNVMALSTLAEYINGFAFKPHHLGEDGLPIVKIPELKEGVRASTPRYDGFDVPERLVLSSGDLLFSWSGTLAIELWADGPAYLNQHLFLVRPGSIVGKEFLLIALRESLPSLMNMTVGATMKHIRRAALDQVKILIPPSELLAIFEEFARDTYAMIINLRQQNLKLVRARDVLLSRLMDGRVSV